MDKKNSEKECLEIIELSAASLDLLADTFDFIAKIAQNDLVLMDRKIEEHEEDTAMMH